ncbi:hypothetical protein ACPPVS_02140 [Cellulomonas sp. McL0617]|uniref:hypothetical protein n=1 Tax=Cellulomonas sp. McL0617 TaxID=3415675 RepID=UPI003CF16355
MTIRIPRLGRPNPEHDSPLRRALRSTRVKLALGGLVLVGVGAVATSAAWTDPAYFSTTVNSASVNLQGRLQGSTTWLAADTAGAAVPLGAITGMVPGGTQTKTIELWNSGTAPLALTWATAPTSIVDATCYSIAYSTLPTNLPGNPGTSTAASTTTATITITLLSTAPQTTCANQTASLAVTVQGTTF